MSKAETPVQKCFMAMPITTQADQANLYGGDQDHWKHVMESLFAPAIRDAGFEPVCPAAQGSHLIHGSIIHHLSTAGLVLVDLSSHNPNVFFELGVRTSLNMPIALVRDEHTDLPFDTSGINTHTYDSKLRGWEILDEQRKLADHIRESVTSCAGQNPLWRQFGLTIRAAEPDANESPLEAKVELLTSQVSQLQNNLAEDRQERRLLEEERNQNLMVERELRLRSASGTQRDTVESDESPVELLASALLRAHEFNAYDLQGTSPGSVALRLHKPPGDPEFLFRAQALADRYGVELRVFDLYKRDRLSKNLSRPIRTNTDSDRNELNQRAEVRQSGRATPTA
ncbi:MAG TPA: hypothetical protein PKE40_01295 [Arachnia sp.]|nr:hypothetical protein [Arachnia sp.]HMT84963.1 hypothetical protein [Arachnia sp.]